MIANQRRKFHKSRFADFPTWLEYSIEKDALFCLYCYLFELNNGDQTGGECFVKMGFSYWKERSRVGKHVGGPNSSHNEAQRSCEALMNQNKHIETILSKHSREVQMEYRTCLKSSIDCVKYLLRQGLAFRGHDESEDSNNRGNFLELLHFLVDHNDDIKVVALKNAPRSLKLTSSDIQKDIARVVASETEQMAVVLRYVDKNGLVIERLIGVEHVTSTTSLSLKEMIDKVFSRHGLSLSRLRGQGYDEATLVAVAKKHSKIASFFTLVAIVVNIVGASAKRCDILQDKQATLILNSLQNDKTLHGRGLNQPISLKRVGDTRWGSHYDTLISVMKMFSSIIELLEIIVDDGSNSDQKVQISLFCEKHEVEVPKMDGIFKARGKSRRKAHEMTNLHYFQVDLFYSVIDQQLQELNDRFNEVNIELLLCVACLSPCELFSTFDKQKLVNLAEFYPKDFSGIELMELDDQLESYIVDMRISTNFKELKGIGELA
uniref:TTF-type domain-containing protein n=1 Tax=Cannabis sativa TaxID=3483 RepID=A0A803Q0Z3_CANSA